jgi:hypothetical protein
MIQELMLIANPSSRGSCHNPTYVAPYTYQNHGREIFVPGYVKNLSGERNPKRRSNNMRNPVSVGAIKKEWLGGLSVMDMGAALGGLAASTMLPGLIITDTSTTLKKVLKIVVAVGMAAGAGFVARNISPTAGKYAIAGGIAGALAQGISAFTSIKIGSPAQIGGGRIRSAENVMSNMMRSDESVQLIRP